MCSAGLRKELGLVRWDRTGKYETGGSFGGLVLGACLQQLRLPFEAGYSAGSEELQASSKKGKYVHMHNKTINTAICTYYHMEKSQNTTTDCFCENVGNLFGKSSWCWHSVRRHVMPPHQHPTMMLLFVRSHCHYCLKHVYSMLSFGVTIPWPPLLASKGRRTLSSLTSFRASSGAASKGPYVHEFYNVAVL